MARINESTFRNYNPGDRITEKEYEREREVLRLAINDVEDKLDYVNIDYLRTLSQDITGINDKIDKNIQETKELNNETAQQLGEVQATVEDLRTNGTGIDVQARKDVQTVTAALADTTNNIDSSYSILSSRHKEKVPIVTFIADDAPLADYTRLLPVVREKSIPFGIGVITSRVGTTNYMSYAQIKEMESAGCEIMAHTHEHRESRNLTTEVLDLDVKTNLTLLRENGFNPTGFIYPYNSHDNNTIKVVKRYYNYAFSKSATAKQGKNYYSMNNQVIERVALGSYFDTAYPEFPSDTTSLEYYKARVDEAVTNGNWLVFVFHTAATDATQLQHLRDVIDYVRSLGIEIVSPSKGFNIYGNIVEIKGEKGDFIIEANGELNITKNRVIVDGLNGRKNTDPVTNFSKDKITFTPTTNTFAASEGFPESKAGYLETYRISADYYHAFQRYVPTTGTRKTYIRYVNSDNTWGVWTLATPQDALVITGLSAQTPSNPYTDFRNQSVTYTPFTTTGATNNNLPRAIAGILKTERIYNEYWGIKQTYTTSKASEPNGIEHEYVRHVNSDGTWTNWVQTKGIYSAATTYRPTNPINGYFYYDTTLKKPIWWSGSAWVDATGNNV